MDFSRNFFSLLLLVVLATLAVDGQIKGVTIMFRHGERTPSVLYPKYNVTKISQDLGAGQLTLTGSRQLYDVGTDLRQRYLQLFPASGYFRMSNMNVVASTYFRAITSLSSFMAGFFPPPAKDKTIPFRWQSFPFSLDHEAKRVAVDAENCPAFAKDFSAPKATIMANVEKWKVQDRAALDRLSEFLGTPLDTFTDILMACDFVTTNGFLDPSQPKWLSDYSSLLDKYVMGYYYEAYYSTDRMKQILGGTILSDTIDNFIAIRDGQSTKGRNFLIYSGHDLTVAAQANVLGVFSQIPHPPAYADTLAVELHQVGKGGWEVQVLYVSGKKKTVLTMPNCGKSCPLNQFILNVQKYYISDWKAVCGK